MGYNRLMKANIHPVYFPAAQISCVCGNTFTAGSTKPQIKVEVCAKCHPFYTGTQKFVDTVGNIERFRSKVKVASIKQAVASDKKKKMAEEEHRPKTLREMLQQAK